METKTLNALVLEWSTKINEMSAAQRKIFISGIVGGLIGQTHSGNKRALQILESSFKESEKWK